GPTWVPTPAIPTSAGDASATYSAPASRARRRKDANAMNAAAPSPAALRPRAAVWPWLLLAAAIIAVDQLTKAYFDAALEYGERIAVLPVFDFTLLYNRGAAFSFLAQQSGWQRWLFTGLGTAAACFILWM